MKGKGNLLLSGKLGEVIQESARLALSYIRSNAVKLGLAHIDFLGIDIAIHFPAGAQPKVRRRASYCQDGPSAGVSIFASLLSLFRETSLGPYLAMTGEISLRGQVLSIGGLSEKIHAAARAGVKVLIAPDGNRGDLEGIPREVVEGMEIVFVRNLDELEGFLFESEFTGPVGSLLSKL
jgi:ATP-dependent Lon protease